MEPAWVAERERASPVPAPAAVFSSAMPDEPQLMLETGPPCAFWLFSCRPQRVPAPAALLVTRAWSADTHTAGIQKDFHLVRYVGWSRTGGMHTNPSVPIRSRHKRQEHS